MHAPLATGNSNGHRRNNKSCLPAPRRTPTTRCNAATPNRKRRTAVMKITIIVGPTAIISKTTTLPPHVPCRTPDINPRRPKTIPWEGQTQAHTSPSCRRRAVAPVVQKNSVNLPVRIRSGKRLVFPPADRNNFVTWRGRNATHSSTPIKRTER